MIGAPSALPLPPRVRGVVFDLDGTLVDSSSDLAGALNTLLATNGAPPVSVDRVKALIGHGARALVDRALAERGVVLKHDPYPAFRAAYRARITRDTHPYPGVVHLLTALRRAGVAVGVCTNKPEALALQLVVGLGLGVLLDALVGGDTLPTKKPDPAPILEALERMGVSAAEAVFVGDSPADIHGAAAAGLPSVGVRWGYGDVTGATVAVDSADALLGLLQEHLA